MPECTEPARPRRTQTPRMTHRTRDRVLQCLFRVSRLYLHRDLGLPSKVVEASIPSKWMTCPRARRFRWKAAVRGQSAAYYLGASAATPAAIRRALTVALLETPVEEGKRHPLAPARTLARLFSNSWTKD